jgi:AcrR family transcriptional regulator
LDRAAVVAEAAALLDAEGAQALTLARLAERLGVRIPSLYNHIAGLADLHRALAAYVAREIAEDLRTAALGRSGADAIFALAAAYRAYVMAHPGRYTLITRVPVTADAALRDAMDAPVQVVLAVLAACGIVGESAIHAVRALRSAVHGFASLEMMGGFQMPIDIEESFHWLIGALVAGLGLREQAGVGRDALAPPGP